jgi:HEAT repeat protein
VANSALFALGRFPQSESKQVLLEAIRSRDNERQSQAIRAFARTNGREFIEALRICVLGSNDRIAGEAAISLSQISLPEAAVALIEAAGMPARRNNCIAALSAMSDAAVPSLAFGLRACELDTRRAIVEALARIRTPKAIDALETALADGQAAVRHAALASLAHIRQFHRMTVPGKVREGRN